MRRRSTAEEDAGLEHRILHAVIDAYPELYTEGELTREIMAEPEGFAARDAIERAVFGLAAVGLLNCSGPLVVPSRAALWFDSLSGS
jgi:hypothetical protein